MRYGWQAAATPQRAQQQKKNKRVKKKNEHKKKKLETWKFILNLRVELQGDQNVRRIQGH